MGLLNGKFLFAVFLLFLVFAFACRYSEQAGQAAQTGYLLAVATSLAAGVGGVYPLYKWQGGNGFGIMLGVLVGGCVRLAVILAAVAIAVPWLGTSRKWFIGWVGVFYIAFLVFDMWVAGQLLKRRNWKRRETQVDGSLWSVVGGFESSARGCK